MRLVGGGGGANAVDTYGEASVCGGGGAYLEKYLTGLTPTHTLQLTIGAGGATGGATGGNTVLASGTTGTTQTITTLTACGGAGATGGANAQTSEVGGIGGVAINGDINISGSRGIPGIISGNACGFLDDLLVGSGGGNPLGSTTTVVVAAGATGATGAAFGGGGVAVTISASVNAAAAGFQGLAIIEWFY